MRPTGTRSVRSRSRRGPAVRGATRREPPPARLRAKRPARTSSPPARSTRRGPERRSSNRTRASITSDCGPTSCGRRRWPSTSSATWPPTSRSADRAVHTWWPDAPGTVCDVRFAHSPGRLDPALPRQPPRVRRGVRARPRRRDAGDRRRRHQVPRASKPEIPKPTNLRRYLEVAERSGVFAPGAIDAVNGIGSRRDVARAPAAAVDAPAPERHVELGPLRRRPPRRQLGLRRRVRPVPRSPRRPVDLLLRDRSRSSSTPMSSRRRRRRRCARGTSPVGRPPARRLCGPSRTPDARGGGGPPRLRQRKHARKKGGNRLQ